MNIDHHDTFQRMIDESLAGVLSAERERSLREHLSTCVPCREYLSASNRVIAGLSGFSFEVNPTLNAGFWQPSGCRRKRAVGFLRVTPGQCDSTA